MAALDKPLLRIGPFKSYDSTTAGPHADPSTSNSASNVDTERYVGAFASSRGRVNLTILNSGTVQAMTHLNRTDTYSAERNIIAWMSGGSIQRYNITSGTQVTVPSGVVFSQAVQFGNVLYTNGGQQIRAASNYSAYYWTGQNLNNGIPPVTITSGGFASGTNFVSGTTYFYAFTTQYLYPDQGTQESNPNESAFNVPENNNTSFTPLGSATQLFLVPSGTTTWYGTAPDGSLYSTNVYRLSTTQPTFYYAGNANSGTVGGGASGTFIDRLADPAIAGNVQLQYRYPNPPTLAVIVNANSNLAPIFRHKERMWVFTVLADSILSSGISQCQLWYSDAGIPWSFFADTNVMLVGDDSDNTSATQDTAFYNGLLNDQPMAGVSLSSVAILHKRRSTWILYGDDPSTFLPRKMGSIGTVSSGSVTVCSSNGDIDAWLSEDGPYLTDGNSLTYIGEPVRGILSTIPQSDWQVSIGWYAGRVWFLSFPATGITLRYYLPKGKWLPPLPYATNAAYSLPSESSPVGLVRLQEIIAARPGGGIIDAWGAADGQDLTNPIISTWESPLTDSEAPGIAKEYQWVVIDAPVQPGVLATGTLVIDQSAAKTTTWSFDLGQGPTLVATPAPDCTGFLAQFTLTVATPAGATAPAIVYSAEVHGSVMRNLVPTQTSAVSRIN